MTLYITITGVVFAAAPRRITGEPRHAYRLGRLHRPQAHSGRPRRRLAARPAAASPFSRIGLAWLLYPLAYLVYTLIRGAEVDWYPFPFLDVSQHGYGGVLLNCAGMLIGFVAAAAAFVAVGSRRRCTRLVTGGLVGRQSRRPISTESHNSPLCRRYCLTRRPSSTKPSLR